jgi:hypothetical protein
MGREVAEQATNRRGRVRRFMAWLGYGPETEPEERRDRDARRARGKAEAAERRARRRAERRARKHSRRTATEEATPAEVSTGEASAPSPGTQAEEGSRELEERLAQMESRARSAEQQADKARADAQASAERARAAAEEARHSIGAISTKLARVEAERRLHEQAERRLESRCAELRDELEREREEKMVIIEHFDRQLTAIEQTAQAAARRIAAAERALIKGSDRPWSDGDGHIERGDRVRNGDPLEALEASLGKDKPRRDGRARELDRPRVEAREPSRTS